ncbi:MAG: hypothetical protein NC816_02305 [Candidatus Omnitrophica bacterium]|nr:hypothetical protein [Candidatus Omnitrophota bacterium]
MKHLQKISQAEKIKIWLKLYDFTFELLKSGFEKKIFKAEELANPRKFSLKEVINTSFLTISGFLLPFLISLIFFTLKGQLYNFIYAILIIGQKYVKAVTLKTGLYRNIAMTANLIIPNFLFFGLALCGVFKTFSNDKNFETLEQKDFIIFLPLQTLFSFFGAYIGKRPIAHYYIPVFPPIVLIATYGFFTLEKEIYTLSSKLLNMFWKWVVILGMFNSFIAFHDISSFLEKWKYVLKSKFRYAEIKDELTLFIQENTLETDTIYVWGYSPEIYLWTNRSSASKFFVPDTATEIFLGGEKFPDTLEISNNFRKNIIKDLEKNKPVNIIDTSIVSNFGFENFPLEKISILWEFIENEYFLEKEIGNVKIYKRKKLKNSVGKIFLFQTQYFT